MDKKEYAAADIQATMDTEKKEFNEPKLKFIEPKLTEHGDATKITGQFFGTFNP